MHWFNYMTYDNYDILGRQRANVLVYNIVVVRYYRALSPVQLVPCSAYIYKYLYTGYSTNIQIFIYRVSHKNLIGLQIKNDQE